ncbi:MAG: hypothetical protein M2R45_02343 [Verrucomicrobia subdivision 3 bacterium]|nr:hypothetical protein [Limisphaerales bacterium]MCS1414895.1 hypothetical protein [Limisphaerales bacterium]
MNVLSSGGRLSRLSVASKLLNKRMVKPMWRAVRRTSMRQRMSWIVRKRSHDPCSRKAGHCFSPIKRRASSLSFLESGADQTCTTSHGSEWPLAGQVFQMKIAGALICGGGKEGFEVHGVIASKTNPVGSSSSGGGLFNDVQTFAFSTNWHRYSGEP